ncbi:MAG: hypothetical protein P8170_24745 [Gemmatimonadota bacterium]|jgi:hypothetical protein
MILPLALALATLVPTPADTVTAGTLSLALTAGADTVDNYVVAGGERRLAITYIQTVSEADDGYLIVQENIRTGGQVVSLDSILVARRSLATVWHGDVTPVGSRHVAFDGRRVRGTVVDSLGEATPVDEAIPSGLFDYSIAMMVANLLPLEEGYEATLATYDIHRGPQFVHVNVSGTEEVTVGGARFDAWRMDVDFGGPPVTRWVDRATRRELRVEVELGERRMVSEARHPG